MVSASGARVTSTTVWLKFASMMVGLATSSTPLAGCAAADGAEASSARVTARAGACARTAQLKA